MKQTKSIKQILLALLAVVVVIGGIIGVLIFLGNRNSAVNVYAMSNLAMDSYWGDQAETYGTVRYDSMQAVYLSNTMQVTDILVEEGSEVKAGDPLIAFDTTLTEIQLQKKELEVQEGELDLKSAQKRLTEINKLKPSSGKPTVIMPSKPAAKTLHPIPSDQLPYIVDESKGTESDPYVIVVEEPVSYTQDWIEKLLKTETTVIDDPEEPTTNEPEEPTTGEPEEPTTDEQEEPTTDEQEEPTTEEITTEEVTTEEITTEEVTTEETTTEGETGEGGGDDNTPAPTQAGLKAKVIKKDMGTCYAVFQVREENALDGPVIKQWGMSFTKEEDDTVTFTIFEPDQIYFPVEEEEEPEPIIIDNGSGYTSAEIREMKKEAQDRITQLDLQLRMDKVELERMKLELSTGEITATMDGRVKSVLTEDEARETNQAIVVVSAGGGYIIESSIGEFDLDTISVGDMAMINSWETGEMCTGIVESVSDVPTENGGYWGDGNMNASNYGVKLRIEDDVNLREYEMVSVTYMNQSGGGENGIYLENPFLREENGRSYVFVRGEDGMLEKRYVRTGKNIWGSYTQILSGLTMDDFIAFPYGRNVRDGAKTNEAEISELYQ